MAGLQTGETQRQKSSRALKTISEAADMIDVPQHVLRFWETKFTQIKPLKRNGGRRFYRPDDIDTLLKIKFLLYKQGYTIKGAKKVFDQRNSEEVLANLAQGRPADATASNDNGQLSSSTAVPAKEQPEELSDVLENLKMLSRQLRTK